MQVELTDLQPVLAGGSRLAMEEMKRRCRGASRRKSSARRRRSRRKRPMPSRSKWTRCKLIR